MIACSLPLHKLVQNRNQTNTFHADVVIFQQPDGVLISVHFCLHQRDIEVSQQTQAILHPSFIHNWLAFLLSKLFTIVADIVESVAKILGNKKMSTLLQNEFTEVNDVHQ